MGKNWLKFLLFMCMASFGMTACMQSDNEIQEEETAENYIYFLNNAETQLVSEPYELQSETPETQIWEYINALMTVVPENLNYKKALPDTVTFMMENEIEDGGVTLNFNDNYLNLKGSSEILCRAAIVKTLCQVEEVDCVEFYVMGQPLKDSNDNPIGFMAEDDFIDNTGGETKYEQNAVILLFYADSEGKKLEETRVRVKYDGTIPIEQLIIEQLMRGPESVNGVEERHLLSVIPEDTVLNKVTTKDGICYVDFNSGFLKVRKDVLPEVTIYAIVNSLVELSDVNKVQFTIDGVQMASYGESVKFDSPFERNLEIIRQREEAE